jgi:hypothetical protein
MKNTTTEAPISAHFDEAWEQEFKCDTCDFSKLYVKTRELFVRREERYRAILERMAQTTNPNGGMCGKPYDELPAMIEALLDRSGDKARLKLQISRLTKENEQLALKVFRLESGEFNDDVLDAIQTGEQYGGCEFCANFDFGTAEARTEKVGKSIQAGISLAGGSSRCSTDNQFKFCPVCGRRVNENGGQTIPWI